MAIEHVFIINNTSILPVSALRASASMTGQCNSACAWWTQDEMLAHRLGLVPLKADPALFSEKTGALAEQHLILPKLYRAADDI